MAVASSAPAAPGVRGKFLARLGKMPPERRLYALAALPRHLAAGAQTDRLRFLLSHFEFLQAKLDELGIRPLIADYEWLAAPVVPAIHRALQKAAHILEVKPSQLWAQLSARLMTSEAPEVHRLLAHSPPGSAWLRTVGPTLEQASGPLRRTIPTQGGELRAVVVTPDGELAVTGSVDCSIKVWNLARGVAIQTLSGHRATVNKLALSADGRTLLSGSQDGEVRLWDLILLRKIAVRPGAQKEVLAVAVTPGGRRAVLGLNGEPCVRVWGPREEILGMDLPGHGQEVGALVVSPDGRLCASASVDGTIRVWDLERGECVRVLEGHQREKKIKEIAWVREGRLLVSVSWDQTLRLWDLAGTAEPRVLRCSRFVMAMAVSEDGRRAVTAEWNKEICLWDLDAGTVLARLIGHTEVITGIAMTPDGRCAVSVGGEDRDLRVWDLEEAEAGRTVPETMTFSPDSVRAVSLDAAGRRALSATRDGDLSFWNVPECRRLSFVKQAHSGYVWSVAITAAGDVALSSCGDGALKAWDAVEGRELWRLQAHTDQICALSISDDGRWSASASWDKTVKIWDLAEGKEESCFPVGDLAVSAVFLDGGRSVAAATADGQLVVFDRQTAQEIWRYDGLVGARGSLLAASERRSLLAFIAGGDVQVWDFLHRKPCCRLASDLRPPTALALSRDGRWLALADDKGRLEVWDVSIRQQVALFWGEGPIHSCALASTCGLVVAAGEISGRVHFLCLEQGCH